VARNWKLGLTFALVTALMWGLLPLGLKAVLAHMDALTATWYRFSISAVIALAWYGHHSGAQLRRLFTRPHLAWSVVALLGLVGNYVLYVLGLDRVNPGASQVLIQIAPLLLLLASVAFFGEDFAPRQWAGLVALALGLGLFFHQRISASIVTSDSYLLGAALLVGAAVLWTCYGLAQRQLLLDFHARDILLAVCLGGSVLLLPLAQPLQVMQLDTTALLLLAFCGLNTIIAYGCFGLAMSHWESSRVSAVLPLVPLLTLFFTWLFNRWLDTSIAAEPLDWLGALGALLVVAGSALATLGRAAR